MSILLNEISMIVAFHVFISSCDTHNYHVQRREIVIKRSLTQSVPSSIGLVFILLYFMLITVSFSIVGFFLILIIHKYTTKCIMCSSSGCRPVKLTFADKQQQRWPKRNDTITYYSEYRNISLPSGLIFSKVAL